MGDEEFKVSFRGILFNKSRVRNEIKWKIRKNYDGIGLHSISILVCCTTMHPICDC